MTDLADRCAARRDQVLRDSGFKLDDFPIDVVSAWRMIRAAYGCGYTDAYAFDLGDADVARAFALEHQARLPIPG